MNEGTVKAGSSYRSELSAMAPPSRSLDFVPYFSQLSDPLQILLETLAFLVLGPTLSHMLSSQR